MPSWGERNRQELDAWIARRPAVRYNDEVARTWARLTAGAQRRGRPRPQNDTWIAACCVRHGIGSVPINTKDFEDYRADGLVLLTGDD